MGARNDVGSHQAITNTLAGVSTCSHSSVNGPSLTTNHHGHITTTDKLPADQGDFGGFGHGISRFNGWNQATGFNHSQGNALHRIRIGSQSGCGGRLGNTTTSAGGTNTGTAGGGSGSGA
jgi:hypothetical protein